MMRLIYLILVAATCAAVASIAAATSHGTVARSGESVFEANCANCHSGGIGGFFSGAPKVGKASDWSSLTAKGVDGLTATTLAGVGDMAPRGNCMTCTDEEIRAAVEHMLDQLK